jgi:hypothetical protein
MEDGDIICRICHEKDPLNELIAPCQVRFTFCFDSLGFLRSFCQFTCILFFFGSFQVLFFGTEFSFFRISYFDF